MALDALLLDLDGTLWPSSAWYEEVLRSSTADSRPIATRLRTAGYTEAKLAGLCARRDPPLDCFDGLLEVLDSFVARGVPIGVVTNLPTWVARPLLQATGASERVDVVVDWSSTSRHKPHPDPILKACRLAAVEPSDRVLYVGDTEGDRTAALAAGIAFHWAGWSDVLAGSADPEILTPADLLRLAR